MIEQSDYIKIFASDKAFKALHQSHLPLCYIKRERKLGFIIPKKCEITNSIVIDAMDDPKDTILVPSSSLFECHFNNR